MPLSGVLGPPGVLGPKGVVTSRSDLGPPEPGVPLSPPDFGPARRMPERPVASSTARRTSLSEGFLVDPGALKRTSSSKASWMSLPGPLAPEPGPFTPELDPGPLTPDPRPVPEPGA